MEDLNKVIDGLNEKLDKHEARQDEISKLVEEVKSKGETGEALEIKLKEINEAHKKDQTEMFENIKTMQTQLDELSAKGKIVPEGNTSSIEKALNENMETLKNWNASSNVAFQVKAGDMTQANTFTNDVAGHTTLPGWYLNSTKDRDVHVRDFMTVLPFDGDSIRYQQETAIDDQSAAKTEGSAAAQSDFDLTEQTATTKTLATYFTVSKEMLRFTPWLEGYIRARGVSRLLKLEDNQLLYGSGSGANVAGLNGLATAYSDSLADSTITEFDVLYSAATQAMVSHYTPNLALIHPNDYRTLALSKETAGMYVNQGAAVNGAPIVANGARVIQTTAVTSGDFFVGDFLNGATLGVNENISISLSNQHSTNFIDGNVTVMVEEKIAFPVTSASAFIYGGFAAALAQGTA